jgi:hypothetical protein
MSMPETGFFFPDLFHIPHPEDGEQKIHLNGWMERRCSSSTPQAVSQRIKSGCPSNLRIESVWVAHSNLTISLEKGFKGFFCPVKGK